MEAFFNTGETFLGWYIHSLNSNPEDLYRVYNEYSIVSFDGKEFQGIDEDGKLKIIKYLCSKEMKKAKYMIVHFSVQPSVCNCILICAQGIVIPDDSKPKEDKSFDMAFYVNISQSKNVFTVINQIYAISED